MQLCTCTNKQICHPASSSQQLTVLLAGISSQHNRRPCSPTFLLDFTAKTSAFVLHSKLDKEQRRWRSLLGFPSHFHSLPRVRNLEVRALDLIRFQDAMVRERSCKFFYFIKKKGEGERLKDPKISLLVISTGSGVKKLETSQSKMTSWPLLIRYHSTKIWALSRQWDASGCVLNIPLQKPLG